MNQYFIMRELFYNLSLRIKISGPVEVQVEQSPEVKKKRQRKQRKSILEKLMPADPAEGQNKDSKTGMSASYNAVFCMD